MKATPEWVHEPDAAELLHIKASNLRNMRRKRRLDAGTHWVYSTWSIGSNLLVIPIFNMSSPKLPMLEMMYT